MRAAMLWAPLVRRNVTIVVPQGRRHTLSARLRVMPEMRKRFQWLQWDGNMVSPLEANGEPETHVQAFERPDVDSEIARLCAIAPGKLQAVPNIPANAISLRFRGLEVARVSSQGTSFPLGEPLDRIVLELDEKRRHGGGHPLSRAYKERWLESNVIDQVCQVVPAVDARHIYPQVPSFLEEQRSIIDLLTVTTDGRLVIIEIKAS